MATLEQRVAQQSEEAGLEAEEVLLQRQRGEASSWYA